MNKCKKMTLHEGMRYQLDKFPNFSVTGSIKGMKDKYYGKHALLVKCGSYIYKVDFETYKKAN